jgi:hypothetical protein
MFNVPEFTVSEFSRSIKRTVEDAFGYVRIHGEISGFKKATSGHLYFALKDENALLSAVCFRGAASGISFEIGDGLQVCASGKITTYEGRSNYQIIVEKIEIAGVGAILEMIEKRRQKLFAEGLFDFSCVGSALTQEKFVFAAWRREDLEQLITHQEDDREFCCRSPKRRASSHMHGIATTPTTSTKLHTGRASSRGRRTALNCDPFRVTHSAALPHPPPEIRAS